MDENKEDVIETVIGKFGRYQIWIYLLIGLARYPTETQLNNVVFVIPGVQYTCLDDNAANATNYCPCLTPAYDQSAIEVSVTSEWNLICNRTSLASLAQSMLQAGILVGGLIYGHISDRYGRKKGILLALSFEVLFIALSALSTNLWMFMAFRFLNGVTVGGTMLCCYVLLIELSGKSFRPFVIALQEIPFLINYFTLPIIAYYVRQWRTLQLVTALPWLICLSYYWLLPESPRWLLSVGRREEAVDILTFIAKKNKRPTEDITTYINKVEFEKPGTFMDLFKTKKMRIYSVIMAFIWMFCANTYFGVSQYIGRLQGNLYINVMLTSLCLSPGLIFVVIATLYFKRKVSVISSFLLSAASLIVIIFIPNNMPNATLAFAIIGQVGAYTAFIQIYLYSCEIFPTVIRNSALGFASLFARLGGFIAPFVVNIGIKWASILVFSSLALCAGILCSFLPETKGIVLLNTIQEMEGLKKKTGSELSTS